MDERGTTVAVGDNAGQAAVCIETMKRALAASGTTIRDVISTRVLVVSSSQSDLVAYAFSPDELLMITGIFGVSVDYLFVRKEGSRPVGPNGQRLNVVDASGLKPNTWHRFERLSSAWDKAKLGIEDELYGDIEGDPGVVANPRRRARTPLTESQVDAIRTARTKGESVVSICRRFHVHRMTVWTHTRDLCQVSSFVESFLVDFE